MYTIRILEEILRYIKKESLRWQNIFIGNIKMVAVTQNVFNLNPFQERVYSCLTVLSLTRIVWSHAAVRDFMCGIWGVTAANIRLPVQQCVCILPGMANIHIYRKETGQRPNSWTKSRQKPAISPCYSQSPLQLCLETSVSSNTRKLLQFLQFSSVHWKGESRKTC